MARQHSAIASSSSAVTRFASTRSSLGDAVWGQNIGTLPAPTMALALVPVKFYISIWMEGWDMAFALQMVTRVDARMSSVHPTSCRSAATQLDVRMMGWLYKWFSCFW